MNRSWKNRKRTGGIRRKCLREYKKLKEYNEKNYNAVLQSNWLNTDQTSEVRVADEEGSVPENMNNSEFNEEGSVSANNGEFIQNFGLIGSTLSEDESDSIDEYKNLTFRSKISQWAIRKNISHSALKDLMEIVNERIPGVLPIDPRTLLKTPKATIVKNIDGGEYWHQGLSEQLKKALLTLSKIPEYIQLNFNIDGLPIFKSTKKEFWPILCNIHEKPKIEPFVIGIYYGSGKPKNLNEYLEDFVTEMETLLKNGLQIYKNDKEETIIIKIRSFICDSPARAYIKGTELDNHIYLVN